MRTDRETGLKEFIERLDSAPPETESWWGMTLADTGLPPGGPLVARVLPGSPAAKAGMRVGDRVRMAGTTRVQTVRDARKALQIESARAAGVRAAAV